MSAIIRTGIIGYGLSGRVFHAPFIHVVEGFELFKISTADAHRVSQAKKTYPTTGIVPIHCSTCVAQVIKGMMI